MGNNPVNIGPDEGKEQITAEQFDAIYDLLYPLADLGWEYEKSPLEDRGWFKQEPKNASEELKEFSEEEANPTLIRRRKLPFSDQTHPWKSTNIDSAFHQYCKRVNLDS